MVDPVDKVHGFLKLIFIFDPLIRVFVGPMSEHGMDSICMCHETRDRLDSITYYCPSSMFAVTRMAVFAQAGF